MLEDTLKLNYMKTLLCVCSYCYCIRLISVRNWDHIKFHIQYWNTSLKVTKCLFNSIPSPWILNTANSLWAGLDFGSRQGHIFFYAPSHLYRPFLSTFVLEEGNIEFPKCCALFKTLNEWQSR
jgi:hypothetical protein